MRRHEAAEQVDERTRREIHTSFSEGQRLVNPVYPARRHSPGSLVDRVRLGKRE